jgi:hypothetical protein
MHSPWKSPIIDTLKIIEEIVFEPEGVIGFNLTFDWFHICQMYTTLLLMKDSDAYLEDCIEEYALNEAKARLGPCLKPKSALDLMLFARKGPYQSTMARDDIRIKRVPNCLAWELAKELETRVQLKDIYFARRKDKHAAKWKVLDITDEDGKVNKHFKNVVLKFSATSALKALATDALGLDPNDTMVFSQVSLPKKAFPHDKQRGFAPYATAWGSPGHWNHTWPDYIKHHIDHWTYNAMARTYAELDVIYLQKLRKHFGNPELGDDDSVLACMVGAIRWRGYPLDMDKLKKLREEAVIKSKAAPTTTKKVKWWVNQLMDPAEQLVIKGSTKKIILEEISDLLQGCPQCKEKGCDACNGKGTIRHPAADRAKACLEARKAKYRIDFIDKLIRAGRFHASFTVIGTKSSRMSGADDLNAQGVDHTNEMRECFTLADVGMKLAGGDFKSYEVVLADAVYDDPQLRKDLQSGRSIHSEFATLLFPGMTYEEVEASSGSKIKDFRDCGKRAVFAVFYGGDENTLKKKIGIDIEIGKPAVEGFVKKKYKMIGIRQEATRNKFCSMTQPKGIGTQVVWRDPADYVESKAGFRRHFTLENMICKTLFHLANKPPPHWKDFKIKVQRRLEGGKEQFASGAVQSALYGAAFGIQSANMRAAVNHEIQSYGAVLIKHLQCMVWELQESGISNWRVVPMNIHDELLVPTTVAEAVKEKVDKFLEETRPRVPLIAIDWSNKMTSWASKKTIK